MKLQWYISRAGGKDAVDHLGGDQVLREADRHAIAPLHAHRARQPAGEPQHAVAHIGKAQPAFGGRQDRAVMPFGRHFHEALDNRKLCHGGDVLLITVRVISTA